MFVRRSTEAINNGLGFLSGTPFFASLPLPSDHHSLLEAHGFQPQAELEKIYRILLRNMILDI
jgi:hypothetical protein